jgi:sugar phosphate isomerase/epimerase
MRDAGTNLIRIMSYPNDQDDPWGEAEWKSEVFKRLRELAIVAEGEGVILGHENCSGYAGLGPDQFLETVEAVDNPAFKLIFDTGNNTFHDSDNESTWRFYEACKSEIVHVHIKAYKPGDDGKYVACYPDEDSVQERVLRALSADSYDGWLSIEPHMAAAIHLGEEAEGAGARKVWLEYARRIEALAAAASS